MKYMLTTINTRWEAKQGVMAAKLTRLTYRIEIQLHLVAERCTIWSSRSRLPVRKRLDTPSYIYKIDVNIILRSIASSCFQIGGLNVVHTSDLSRLCYMPSSLTSLTISKWKENFWSSSLCNFPEIFVT